MRPEMLGLAVVLREPEVAFEFAACST